MNVKVCGLTREHDVQLACSLGAWAVGFVFASSPRRVTVQRARELRRVVARGTLAVGVFVDAPRAEVLEAVRDCRLDAVQLHGNETPEECLGFPVPVIKGLAVSTEADLAALDRYKVARYLLEPARTLEERRRGVPPTLESRRACWSLAAKAKGSILLAGGLTPQNVAEAVRAAKPFGVDVSGGVEVSFGVKDPAKLKAFFAAVGLTSKNP